MCGFSKLQIFETRLSGGVHGACIPNERLIKVTGSLFFSEKLPSSPVGHLFELELLYVCFVQVFSRILSGSFSGGDSKEGEGLLDAWRSVWA